MYKKYIKGAEINLYLSNNDIYTINLSETQLKIINKILGIKIDLKQDTISQFSDETLNKFMTLKNNPLRFE